MLHAEATRSYAEAWWTESAHINSDSDQDPYQVISTQKCQHQLKEKNTLITISREHSEALLSIQDRLITNSFIQDKIYSKRKERYYHWKWFMDNNVSLPWLFKQVCVRKDARIYTPTKTHALIHFAKPSNHTYAKALAIQFFIPSLNLCIITVVIYSFVRKH